MKKNRTTKLNQLLREDSKQKITYYMKRRPVKRTAFHRIGSRKQ